MLHLNAGVLAWWPGPNYDPGSVAPKLASQQEQNTGNITSLTVIVGTQSFSNNDKETLPDGKTFGWNIGGSNTPKHKHKNSVNNF